MTSQIITIYYKYVLFLNKQTVRKNEVSAFQGFRIAGFHCISMMHIIKHFPFVVRNITWLSSFTLAKTLEPIRITKITI